MVLTSHSDQTPNLFPVLPRGVCSSRVILIKMVSHESPFHGRGTFHEVTFLEKILFVEYFIVES